MSVNKSCIERATVDDAAQLLDVQKRCFVTEAEITGDPQIPPMVETLDDYVDAFDQHVILKLTVNGTIIGSVRGRAEKDTVQVGRLVVLPEYRKQGCGTLLMRAIEEAFPKARDFELFTGEQSKENVRFYEKLGYRVYTKRPLSDKVTLVFLRKPRQSSN